MATDYDGAIGPILDDSDTGMDYWTQNQGHYARGYKGMFESELDKEDFGSFEDLGVPLIPESDWDDVIRELNREQASLRWLADEMNLPCKNQQSVPYCWVFAPTYCCEMIRLKETGSIISYSPASCGAPVKGFRRVGGWGSQALKRMRSHGLNYSDDWPDTAVSRRYFTSENKEKALDHIVLEFFILKSWEERVSCILAGIPTADGYNWWRHEVAGVGVTVGSHDLVIRNSWSMRWGDRGYGTLRGRKKHANDSVAITAMKPL